MNPLTLFLAWRDRRRGAYAMRIAERRRYALIAQIAERRSHKAEWKPMVGMLRQSTNASLAAACGRKWPEARS